MTGPTYATNGKQILRTDEDGTERHFLDACDTDAARAVATLLNCETVTHEPGASDEDLDHMVEVLWS